MKGLIAIIVIAVAAYFIFFKNDPLPKECNEMITELGSFVDILREDTEFSRGLRSGFLKDKADKFDNMTNAEFLANVTANVKLEYKKSPDQTIKKCQQGKVALEMVRAIPRNLP